MRSKLLAASIQGNWGQQGRARCGLITPIWRPGGRPKSGVGHPGDRRLNAIIGGQADRLRREILDMPNDITRIDFSFEIK